MPALSLDPGECGPCLRRPPPQSATVAAFAYAFPVDRLLLKLKFGNSLPPGRVLGELLAIAVRSTAPTLECPEAIVPVPLHPKRLRERGYNQALELARPVARALRIPVLRACRRTRNTPPQSTLAGPERRRNLKDAFVAEPQVAGLHLAVVDDVYTTGNTIAAVTRALYRAGAASVVAWCVARA
ncbi:MAG: ComF family protein [Xanthomonadaceae bacterium]|nr:ComF family protein [Xanthomonadaceae bacterium]